MTKKVKEILIISVCTLAVCALLFFLGYITGTHICERNKPDPITIWIPGDTIRDSIPNPVPYEVNKPIDTLSILQHCINNHLYDYLIPIIIHDSIAYVSVDTMGIIEDWLTERSYNTNVIDNDTIGKLDVNTTVQFNKLTDISYQFIPMMKQTTIETNSKRLEFFVCGGMATNSIGILNAGIYFRNDFGFSGIYMRDFNHKQNNFGLMINYKF